MTEWFRTSHPAVQALFAGVFTWAITALGAALVLFTAQVKQRTLDAMEGFAAGVMIAASYWSLLAPSIEMSAGGRLPVWFPPAIGFLLGGACLWAVDKLLPHLHRGLKVEQAEGVKTAWSRNLLLILAITLHNIPEGLAVSLPLRREGASRWKSFLCGQASALVEPLAAVLGAAVVVIARPVLPYAMSFAAGAMMFVVVEELIPESHRSQNHDLATLGALAGFVAMMVLDLAFG